MTCFSFMQLAVILLAVALSGCNRGLPRLPENAYAGKTETIVRSELGTPDRAFAGP